MRGRPPVAHELERLSAVNARNFFWVRQVVPIKVTWLWWMHGRLPAVLVVRGVPALLVHGVRVVIDRICGKLPRLAKSSARIPECGRPTAHFRRLLDQLRPRALVRLAWVSPVAPL